MNSEQRLNEIHERVVRIDTTLSSRGGLLDRMDKAETQIAEHETLKTKLLTWCSLIAIVTGIAVQWLKDKITGKS